MNNDLISRSELMKECESRKMNELFPDWEDGMTISAKRAVLKYANRMRRVIESAPNVDAVEVTHGSWQGEGDGYADGHLVCDVWYCSECGYCIDDGTDDPRDLSDYCPNCGAKMDGGNSDENA